jgi:hypothetical protein
MTLFGIADLDADLAFSQSTFVELTRSSRCKSMA